MGYTLIVGRISRFLLSAKLRNRMHLSIEDLLAIALINNGEGSGDARLLLSEILQHLSHGGMAFFLFVGNCHGSDPDQILIRLRSRARAKLRSRAALAAHTKWLPTT